MNILYVLGNGSKWGDNELRYSLRSIDKFGMNVGGIYLCGTHMPKFLNEKIRFSKFCGERGHPSKNVAAEISQAIEEFGDDLGGDFLLSSDDHFYTKPTDFDRYPYYDKGELPSELSQGIFGDLRYTRTLVNTRRLLEEAGLPTRNYAHHANAHIDARIWRKCSPIFKKADAMDGGAEPTCVALNALAAESGFSAAPRKDIKIRSGNEIVKTLKSECFSVYDSAIEDGVGEWLKMAFPTPSKWERNP